MAGATAQREDEDTSVDGIVLRRSGRGWQVGPEQMADLTSAMVLADLLAADLGPPAPRPVAPRPAAPRPPRPPRELRVTLPRRATRPTRATPTRRRGWR